MSHEVHHDSTLIDAKHIWLTGKQASRQHRIQRNADIHVLILIVSTAPGNNLSSDRGKPETEVMGGVSFGLFQRPPLLPRGEA